MLTKEQKDRLNDDLPTRAIASREQAGRTFSYVEGWWVIDRLNAIVGPGEWSYDCEPRLVVEAERDGGTDRNGKPKGMRWHVTYTAKCTLRVGGAVIGDHGAGHGVDKDQGAAHESAIKEACTDALKRCAKSLGRSLGLALYDKEQAHVVEPEDEVRSLLSSIERAASAADLDACKARASMLKPHMPPAAVRDVAAAIKSAAERVTGGKAA